MIVDEKHNPRGILPHPCDGPMYYDWEPVDFVLKALEEVGEMAEAFRLYREEKRKRTSAEKMIEALETLKSRYDDVMRESTDAKTAIEGFMASLGADQETREEFQAAINESNARRDSGRRFAK